MTLYVQMTDDEYNSYKEFLRTKDKNKVTDYSIEELAAGLLNKIKGAGGQVDSKIFSGMPTNGMSGNNIIRTVAKIYADGFDISLGIDEQIGGK